MLLVVSRLKFIVIHFPFDLAGHDSFAFVKNDHESTVSRKCFCVIGSAF